VKKKYITTSTPWTSTLIKIILEYSFSLWDFRNGILHGLTTEDTAEKEFNSIATWIRTAYHTYQEDPFHIPSRWRSLFISRTLDQHLKQDIDTLNCWLRSYDEALASQRDSTLRHSEAAKNFFKPRRPQSSSASSVNTCSIPDHSTPITPAPLVSQQCTALASNNSQDLRCSTTTIASEQISSLPKPLYNPVSLPSPAIGPDQQFSVSINIS
jgi:hypothetical protein